MSELASESLNTVSERQHRACERLGVGPAPCLPQGSGGGEAPVSVGVVSAVLVGRGSELGVLVDALDRAAAESPSTVLVGGESGVGKSRLVREFAAGVGERARVLVGVCVELGGEGLPYAPFTAALRGSDVSIEV